MGIYPLMDAIAHEYEFGDSEDHTAASRSPFDWFMYQIGMRSFRAFAGAKPTWILNYSWDGAKNVAPRDAMLNLAMSELTAGANVWDARKCIDYLQSRNDVDSERIGAAGLSYGGTMTLWTAALDERVKIADVSCYMNSFQAYALHMDNTCGSQPPVNVLGVLDEMWEVAALIAPRALVCENGISDGGFPIAEAQAAHAKIAEAYERAGVGDRFAADVFEGGHEFSGRKAFDWFAKYLDWKA